MGDDPMDWLADYEAAPGSNIDTTGFRSVDYFMIFFPQEAVDLIVRETNRYARNFIENDQLKENAIMKKWKETTQDEMIKVFLALQIGMGMDQRAQEMDHWRKFWLTSNKFSDIMSRKRYKQLKNVPPFCRQLRKDCQENILSTTPYSKFNNFWILQSVATFMPTLQIGFSL